MKPAMRKMMVIPVVAVLLLAATPVAVAQPGTLIQNVPLPVPGVGVSVAVDCEGNVYYTLAGSTNLFKMDKDGNLLSTVPIVDSLSGQGLEIDEFAWDETRKVLWSQLHNSNPIDVYQIVPSTGIATFQFTSITMSVGTFRDGIAFDGDDTLWITGDVSTTIEHYTSAGGFINQITPKNAMGDTLGAISGVTVGVGDLLYLGRNGFVQIVQVKKSNGDFIASFASPGGARDEGLECDAVNFAPKLALWSREFNSPGFISAIELEPDTCACGGVSILTLDMDIKPGSCPNSFNRNNNGVLPVGLLGTDDFDVSDVDLSTVELSRSDGAGGSATPHNGPPGPSTQFADVGTPFDGEPCDCHELEGDGITDLSFKFKSQEVVAALELDGLMPGMLMKLKLTGQLLDGRDFEAEDCIRIVPPGTGPGLVSFSAPTPSIIDAWLDVGPMDLTIDGGGFDAFERAYEFGTLVQITAPQVHMGLTFDAFRIDGVRQGPGVNEIDLFVIGDHDVRAIYKSRLGRFDVQPSFSVSPLE